MLWNDALTHHVIRYSKTNAAFILNHHHAIPQRCNTFQLALEYLQHGRPDINWVCPLKCFVHRITDKIEHLSDQNVADMSAEIEILYERLKVLATFKHVVTDLLAGLPHPHFAQYVQLAQDLDPTGRTRQMVESCRSGNGMATDPSGYITAPPRSISSASGAPYRQESGHARTSVGLPPNADANPFVQHQPSMRQQSNNPFGNQPTNPFANQAGSIRQQSAGEPSARAANYGVAQPQPRCVGCAAVQCQST